MGLVILCPGQGAQDAQMFNKVAGQPAAQSVLEQASRLLDTDLRQLTGTRLAAHIYDNQVAQPLIVAASLATWLALKDLMPAPLLMAGYSIGELSAHTCAGTFPVEVALQLAIDRAQLMDTCREAHGGMAVFKGLHARMIERLCEANQCEIAIINGADHFAIGGAVADLEKMINDALLGGAHLARLLPVSVSSHISRMRSITPRFAARLQQAQPAAPVIPVLAAISGMVVRTAEQSVGALSAQLSEPIRWEECMASAIEMGGRVFLELGPGSSLIRMLQEAHPGIAARSVTEFRTIEGAAVWVCKQLDD